MKKKKKEHLNRESIMSLHSISMPKCLLSTPKELSGLSCVNNSCQPSVFHMQYIP